jgi:CheY-like chemotaxis protein
LSGTILIVEDNPDQRDFLAIMLEQQGYTIHTATDGSEGLRLIKSFTPDLIISDIMMPNLDGIEMVKELKKNPEYQSIPVLMLSAYGTNKLFEAINAGASHVMRKPLDFDFFFKAIDRLLP